MSTRWAGWPAAILAMLVTAALVGVELSDGSQRRWWGAHPLTTDTVSGLLVLLITVLVVNQLLRRRQAVDRGQAVASQAMIMVGQATRTAKMMTAALDGSGERAAASDEFRTYMMMLLVGAPVLIDDRVARRFLEEAQHFGGVLARTLAALDGRGRGARGRAADKADKADGTSAQPATAAGLDEAMARLQTAADPLLHFISPEVRELIQRADQTAEETG